MTAKRKLEILSIVTSSIRSYFLAQGFWDLPTPPVVESPGLEPHLHPFKISATYKSSHHTQKSALYLHTSPEFKLKEALSFGIQKAFTITHCFRDEPPGPHHRFQFLMLEWYRQQERYEKIIEDIDGLISCVAQSLSKSQVAIDQTILSAPLKVKTMDQVFHEFIGHSFFEFPDRKDFEAFIFQTYPQIPKQKNLCWDDLFFLLFLNEIEPQLKKYPRLIIKEFPASQAALSTIKKDDPRVCERFELYLNGVEICNCFNELLDSKEQERRAKQELALKKQLYDYQLPYPKTLMDALNRGINSPSCGVALGVERLAMMLTGVENIFWD